MKPRMKPPSVKPSSNCIGEAGDDSWSSIECVNFCCRIDEELLEKALIAQAIMIRPGITNSMYL